MAERSKDEMVSLFDGASISTLAQIFDMDNREVSKRIAGMQPSGTRDGHPVYRVADAARYLVDPIVNIEEFIQTLKPKDLPVGLQKGYWEAQNAKLKWEEDAKQLWRTEKVSAVFVEAFKSLQSGIRMFEDSVENETALTEPQRAVIRSLSDGLLLDLKKCLLEQFGLHVSYNEMKDAA